ncbi:MAG: hypothetical protein V7739_18845 [Motiliproteus sp.]
MPVSMYSFTLVYAPEHPISDENIIVYRELNLVQIQSLGGETWARHALDRALIKFGDLVHAEVADRQIAAYLEQRCARARCVKST